MLRRSAERGFLGGMEIDEQIRHALGFVHAVEAELGRPPRSVIDLGTGGGLPGLVLIASWTSAQVVLFDANERRTEFLQGEIESWGVSHRVDVVRGRAEEVGRSTLYRQQFEVATARSFGSPAVTAECGSPFVEVNGWMIVSEPPEDDSEDRWPSAGVAQLGLVLSPRVRFDERFSYQPLQKVDEIPDRYPRRTGIPAKRPLF